MTHHEESWERVRAEGINGRVHACSNNELKRWMHGVCCGGVFYGSFLESMYLHLFTFSRFSFMFGCEHAAET